MDRERASFTTSRVRSELDRSEASAIAEILSTRKVSTLRNYPCSAYLTRGNGTIALSNAKSRRAVKACSWAVCDIFAPAPSISATRSSITLAVSEGWESQPLGVSTAFCQAEFSPLRITPKSLLLRRSTHGLKSAPLAWSTHIQRVCGPHYRLTRRFCVCEADIQGSQRRR